MKSALRLPIGAGYRHSPHGECGLKYQHQRVLLWVALSLPAWGVRVEIHAHCPPQNRVIVTPRMGSAG